MTGLASQHGGVCLWRVACGVRTHTACDVSLYASVRTWGTYLGGVAALHQGDPNPAPELAPTARDITGCQSPPPGVISSPASG